MNETTHEAADRTAWIDHARGLAITLVVFGHALHITVRQTGADLPFAFDWIDRAIYLFHVPVFFILSGLLFMRSFAHRGGAGLLGHRVRTLLYPYALWSLLHVLMEALAGGGKAGHASADCLSILYFPLAHFWFLYALFCCVAIGVVVRILMREDRRSAAVLILVALTWYGVHAHLPAGPLRDLGRNLPYFAVGALWSVMAPLQAGLRTRGLVVVGSWLLFIGAALVAIEHDAEALPLARLPLGLLGVMATLLTAALLVPGRATAWLTTLGRRSLVIYLTHVFAIHALFIAWRGESGSWPVALGIATVAGLALPLLLDTVSRRMGLSRRLGF